MLKTIQNISFLSLLALCITNPFLNSTNTISYIFLGLPSLTLGSQIYIILLHYRLQQLCKGERTAQPILSPVLKAPSACYQRKVPTGKSDVILSLTHFTGSILLALVVLKLFHPNTPARYTTFPLVLTYKGIGQG